MIEQSGGEFEPNPEESVKGDPDEQHSNDELDEFQSALDALFTMSDEDFIDVLKKLEIKPNPQKKHHNTQPETTEGEP